MQAGLGAQCELALFWAIPLSVQVKANQDLPEDRDGGEGGHNAED